MTNGNYPFFSFTDGKYYFWLGGEAQGPYEEYVEAHAALTKYLEESKDEE